MDRLELLINYIYKRYKEPNQSWSKKQYEKRCIEISTGEEVISKCMDSPNENPMDIIEWYSFEVQCMMRDETNDDLLYRLNIKSKVLDNLYNYLTKEETNGRFRF